MSAPGSHPTAEDLRNLAREKLGKKKTQRVLEHCKGCPPCAESLLDEVSRAPASREPLRLSAWNWISIGILLAAILALFGLMVWLLRGAASGALEDAGAAGERAEVVHVEQPHAWFEALFTHAEVGPDERAMLRVSGLDVDLVDLDSGAELAAELALDFSGVMDATFDGNGVLARRANRRRDLGWFVERGEELQLSAIPHDAEPVWAPGNADVAWTRPPSTRLFLGEPPRQRSYDAGGRIIGLAWGPAGEAAYALVMDADGVASLVRARRATTRVEVVRAGLDASPLPNGVTVSPDGETVFVALAAAGPVAPEDRHRPAAGRDLDIYGIDTGNGELRAVAALPGDDFWPVVAGDSLYWTRNEYSASVQLWPLRPGGSPAPVTVTGARIDDDDIDAQLPSWQPDGARLAVTRGRWRLADWGLPFDVVTLAVTGDGRISGPPQPLIEGHHQDLSPAFSPDGRWIAYRSRRSATAVPYYSGPGVADAVFLRRADDARAPERPITEAGWEVGGPSWAPAGRRLVYDTWERGGVPRIARPWIVTIDPERGEALSQEPLPLPAEVGGSVSAVFSPIDDRLLLIERRDARSQTLWIVAADGSEARRLVDFAAPTAAGADWTPDGAEIVYAAEHQGRLQIFAVDAAGGAPRPVAGADADLLHPRVSPDGRWVAVTRLQQRKEVRRLALEPAR